MDDADLSGSPILFLAIGGLLLVLFLYLFRSSQKSMDRAAAPRRSLAYECVATPLGKANAELRGKFPALAALASEDGVELVDDRNCDYATLEALSLIADNSWNAGIVVGEWREPPADLGAIEGVVQRNGEEIGRGFGRDALGHPYIPLTWLANFRAGTDRPLKQGDVVMTGSLIRTNFPTEACKYRYELGGLGVVEVEVQF